MRFSASAAMATSVARRPSVRKRSPSPRTRFHLEMSASTKARQLYPDALCRANRPEGAQPRDSCNKLMARCLAQGTAAQNRSPSAKPPRR